MHTHTHTHTLSLSLSHTHTHTHNLILTIPLKHTHSLSLSPSHTHTTITTATHRRKVPSPHQLIETLSTQEVDDTTLYRLWLRHLLVQLLLLEGGGAAQVHVQQVTNQRVGARDHCGLGGWWSATWWGFCIACRLGALVVTVEFLKNSSFLRATAEKDIFCLDCNSMWLQLQFNVVLGGQSKVFALAALVLTVSEQADERLLQCTGDRCASLLKMKTSWFIDNCPPTNFSPSQSLSEETMNTDHSTRACTYACDLTGHAIDTGYHNAALTCDRKLGIRDQQPLMHKHPQLHNLWSSDPHQPQLRSLYLRLRSSWMRHRTDYGTRAPTYDCDLGGSVRRMAPLPSTKALGGLW